MSLWQWWFLCIVLGVVLTQPRGRTFWGFMLPFMFGPAGLLIALMLPAKRKLDDGRPVGVAQAAPEAPIVAGKKISTFGMPEAERERLWREAQEAAKR